MRLPCLLAVAFFFGIGAAPALGAEQSLTFPDSGWYFISLQVQPSPDDPGTVLAGLNYDHIWQYDATAEQKWQHYSPLAVFSGPDLKDLNEVDHLQASQGYWIRVGKAGSVTVRGDQPPIQRIQGDGWHAVGPFLAPKASANVEAVFADLGAALQSTVREVWTYDPGNGFQQIWPTFPNADCSANPERCMSAGQGYWVRTSGDVILGQELSFTNNCVVITPDSPSQRVDLKYEGLRQLDTYLRIEPASGTDPTGLSFVAAAEAIIEGKVVPQPAQDGRTTDGPNTCRQDSCGGQSGCANACFTSPSDRYSLYVTMSPETLGAATFSTCDDPYAWVYLYAAGDANTELGKVAVAVRPAIWTGEYAGSLFYDDSGLGEVPLHLIIAGDADGSTVAAMINPTILASTTNGIDDDGDGEIDEADEDRSIPRQNSPAFPPEFPLYGTVSSDGLVRLEGGMPVSVDLQFANDDNEGIAASFGGSNRQIVLLGARATGNDIEGRFIDTYTNVSLGSGQMTTSGRFQLFRTRAPSCFARDPGATKTIPLNILCAQDSDCPGRCTGNDAIEGFACRDASDCKVNVWSGGVKTPVEGSCDTTAFHCSFTTLTDTAQAKLQVSSEQLYSLPAPNTGYVALGLQGGGETSMVIAHNGAFRTALACGEYKLVALTPGCSISGPSTFNPCTGPQPTASIICSSSAPTPAPSFAAGMYATVGGHTLAIVGGVDQLAPATYHFEHLDTGTPCDPNEAAAGGCTVVYDQMFPANGDLHLVDAAGQGVYAGTDPSSPAQSTSLLRWQPIQVHSGILNLKPEGTQ